MSQCVCLAEGTTKDKAYECKCYNIKQQVAHGVCACGELQAAKQKSHRNANTECLHSKIECDA